MDSRSNSASNSDSPRVLGPTPQRSRVLGSHLSVTFSILKTVIPLRRTTLRPETDERPVTAPPTYEEPEHRYFVAGKTPRGRVSIPRIRIHSLADSEPLFPNDETRYHPFASIEHSRCTFCGMRSAHKSSPNDPCEDCRSRSPFSYMGLGFLPKRRVKANRKTPAQSRETFSGHSTSSDEAPRIVPPEIAAKRAGNPPRKARLPVPRPGATSNILGPHFDHSVSHSLSPESALLSTRTDQRRKSAPESDMVRPTSPKLHHIHGLPNSKAYPYVHKSEVPQHFAAIRAGAPSPLADFAHDAREKRSKADRSTDFTETVYYGKIPKPALISDVRKRRPGQTEWSHVVEELPMEQSERGERLRGELQYGSEQLDHSGAYRGWTREQESPRSHFARLFSRHSSHPRAPSGEDGLRPEGRRSRLKNNTTTMHGADPGLRGGGVVEPASHPRRELLAEHILLTCHSPDCDYRADSSSDDNDLPARSPDPTCITRATRRTYGTARLPRHISRLTLTPPSQESARHVTNNRDAVPVSFPRTAIFAPTYTASPIPLHRLSSPKLDNSRSTPSSASIPDPMPMPPTLSLRGGAGSPSTLHDYERVPPTLLWLAGGGRKPMSTASWKAGKPKRRVSGGLGLGVYGLRAGEAYERGGGKNGASAHVVREEKVERGSGLDEGSASAKSRSVVDSNPDAPNVQAAATGEAQEDAPSSPVVKENIEDKAPVAAGGGLKNAAEDPPVEAPASETAADATAGEAAGDGRGEGATAEKGSEVK